jgi:signal transduction histidine kinase
LNYARVLRGQVPLSSIDLDHLVREILTSYPQWQPPKASINIEGVLHSVWGHEGFLTQCISNLLSNAVKFVPGGVVPNVRIWAENGKGAVRLFIEDNGIGIAPEDHSRVFRMFERICPATEYEGTGIGLTIVRKAVERMGGTVDFQSECGKGSRFWIELKRPSPA